MASFFNGCDLTADPIAELLHATPWLEDANTITLTPSAKLILELSLRTRSQIYSVLAEDPRNDFHHWPFICHPQGLENWFESSGLSEPTLALSIRLVYPRGASLCFSDLPEVFAQVPTDTERRRPLKTLSRPSTLLMRARIEPEPDIKALTQHWFKGGRAKDIEPLLESLTKVPGGITIDVAHLLPPFVRKRLNTYPLPPEASSSRSPDCDWTAMNFCNDPPDDRYYDDAVWRSELERDSTTVSTPVFGDLAFLVRPNGTPVHAAVPIADDVFFTKNGGNYRQPWMLMKWDDLQARYSAYLPFQPVFFRRKALSE